MMFKTLATVLIAGTAGVLAAPGTRSLPTGTVTCGSVQYSVSAVSAAVAQGYKYYKAGSTVGMFTQT
jgi:hypothetical protein